MPARHLRLPCPAPCDDDCCDEGESCVLEWVGSRYIRRCCRNEAIIGGQCCDGDKTICGPAGQEICCPAGKQCYRNDLYQCWMCCAGEVCGGRCCTGATHCFSGCGTPDGKACCIGEAGCGCCRICT